MQVLKTALRLFSAFIFLMIAGATGGFVVVKVQSLIVETSELLNGDIDDFTTPVVCVSHTSGKKVTCPRKR